MGGLRSSSQEKMTFDVGFTLLNIVVKEASKVKVNSTVGKWEKKKTVGGNI